LPSAGGSRALGTAEQAPDVAVEFASPPQIHPAAPHGFHADYRPSYRKEAADAAWSRLSAWFKANKVLG
jgi:carboxymethylenebutenolidase